MRHKKTRHVEQSNEAQGKNTCGTITSGTTQQDMWNNMKHKATRHLKLNEARCNHTFGTIKGSRTKQCIWNYYLYEAVAPC